MSVQKIISQFYTLCVFVSEVPVGCINREVQLAMRHRGLGFGIESEGLHTETITRGEFPKG